MSKLLLLVLAMAGVSLSAAEDMVRVQEQEISEAELEDLDLEMESLVGVEPTMPFQGRDEQVEKLEKAVADLKKTIWGNVNGKCPENYTWNSRLHLCYKIHNNDEVPWSVASLICRLEAEGGRLAVFKSDAERIAVTADIQAIDGEKKFNYFVGARRGVDKIIRWTDGSGTDKMTWCEDEPSGTDCGNLWGRKGHCMDDAGCQQHQRFVCERPVD